MDDNNNEFTVGALGLRPLADIRAEQQQQAEVVEVVEGEIVQSVDIDIYEGSDQLPAIPDPDVELLNDIVAARKNVKNVIKVGKDALTEIVSIAKQTESPTAFLAANQLMKTLLDASRELINTAKEKKFEKTEQPNNHTTTTNNVTTNNLVMSTQDLLDMLADKKKK